MAIIEIGGTIGDIESLPFQEAIRQFKWEVGKENVLYIHLTLVPYIKAAGEVKTKPTQHSVKELQSIGIQPDIILCRTEKFLSKEIKAKIALFCNVDVDQVYSEVCTQLQIALEGPVPRKISEINESRRRVIRSRLGFSTPVETI